MSRHHCQGPPEMGQEPNLRPHHRHRDRSQSRLSPQGRHQAIPNWLPHREVLRRLAEASRPHRPRSPLHAQSLYPLKWDLGLPDGFEKVLVPKYPDCFRFVKASDGVTRLKVIHCPDEFAVSALQRSKEGGDVGDEYRQFKRGQTVLAFPMSFPRGYGAPKKVRAWMEEFQKLPYISPYEDSRQIDPNSDLMEKRVVGVLHELLSLTIHKKTKRNYVRIIREELNLPHKFTRIFTRCEYAVSARYVA
ncbi:hypothetical protein ACLB2K_056056 [Fragaria x ananassa]